MTKLDELARSARADLTYAADVRSRSRPELDVLRRRGVMRHTTSVVALILLVAAGATGLIRLVTIGELAVPVIGEIDPAPTDDDEATDEETPPPDTELVGPVMLEFDSGNPDDPYRLTITVDDDGDVCLDPAGGTGTSSVWGGPSCGDRVPAGSLTWGRATWSSSVRGTVQSCEVGVVHEDVGAVELHFPDGSVQAAEVLPAPEIGDAYYATCWEGDRGLSTLVVFDADGRELERAEYGQR